MVCSAIADASLQRRTQPLFLCDLQEPAIVRSATIYGLPSQFSNPRGAEGESPVPPVRASIVIGARNKGSNPAVPTVTGMFDVSE